MGKLGERVEAFNGIDQVDEEVGDEPVEDERVEEGYEAAGAEGSGLGEGQDCGLIEAFREVVYAVVGVGAAFCDDGVEAQESSGPCGEADCGEKEEGDLLRTGKHGVCGPTHRDGWSTRRCAGVGEGIGEKQIRPGWRDSPQTYESLGFEGGYEGWDYGLDVADDAVVGVFEDWGFGVAIDGDDGFDLPMPDRCWTAPEMPMAK